MSEHPDSNGAGNLAGGAGKLLDGAGDQPAESSRGSVEVDSGSPNGSMPSKATGLVTLTLAVAGAGGSAELGMVASLGGTTLARPIVEGTSPEVASSPA